MPQMKKPPSKEQMAKSLSSLSKRMFKLSVDMEYYGGFAYWASDAKALKHWSILIGHLANSVEHLREK